MTSKYDRRDPGEDADYCNGLSNHGPFKPPMLTCQQCAFRGDFTEALAHYRATAHDLTYKGTVQVLSEVGR